MAGGPDLLHLKRLTWDAIESQAPATAERLARELAVPVKSVCEWLDGDSKPADTHVLAMIKMTRANESLRLPDGRFARPPSKANDASPDDGQPPAQRTRQSRPIPSALDPAGAPRGFLAPGSGALSQA